MDKKKWSFVNKTNAELSAAITDMLSIHTRLEDPDVSKLINAMRAEQSRRVMDHVASWASDDSAVYEVFGKRDLDSQECIYCGAVTTRKGGPL